jgi:hypothetical protein
VIRTLFQSQKQRQTSDTPGTLFGTYPSSPSYLFPSRTRAATYIETRNTPNEYSRRSVRLLYPSHAPPVHREETRNQVLVVRNPEAEHRLVLLVDVQLDSRSRRVLRVVGLRVILGRVKSPPGSRVQAHAGFWNEGYIMNPPPTKRERGKEA